MSSQTTRQNTEMVTKRTALRRRLAAFRAVQAIYMPCAPSRMASYTLSMAPVAAAPSVPRPPAAESATATRIVDRPEDEPLFLPHQLTPTELQACAPGLARIEERLRDAQLDESLDKLRVQLHIKARTITYKNRHLRHQTANTRARRLLAINQERTVSIAEKYRAARVAKLVLAPGGTWQQVWRILQPSDIRTMLAEDDPVNLRPNEAESSDNRLLSEGRRTTSWIWMAADRETEDSNPAIQRDMQEGEIKVKFVSDFRD